MIKIEVEFVCDSCDKKHKISGKMNFIKYVSGNFFKNKKWYAPKGWCWFENGKLECPKCAKISIKTGIFKA